MHALERLRERYGLGEEAYKIIEEKLRNGNYYLVKSGKARNGRGWIKKVRIDILGETITLIVSSRGKIITIY